MTHHPNVNQRGGTGGAGGFHGSYQGNIERELASGVPGSRSSHMTETLSFSPLLGSACLLRKSLSSWRSKRHPSQWLCKSLRKDAEWSSSGRPDILSQSHEPRRQCPHQLSLLSLPATKPPRPNKILMK